MYTKSAFISAYDWFVSIFSSKLFSLSLYFFVNFLSRSVTNCMTSSFYLDSSPIITPFFALCVLKLKSDEKSSASFMRLFSFIKSLISLVIGFTISMNISNKYGTVFALYFKKDFNRLSLIRYSFLIENLCSFFKQSS